MMYFLMFLILCGVVAGFIMIVRMAGQIRDLNVSQIEILQRLEFLKRKFSGTSQVVVADKEEKSLLKVPVRPVVPLQVSVAPPPVPVNYIQKPELRPPVSAPPSYPDDIETGFSTAASRITDSVNDILKRIWNWILVGEEHRRPGMSAEIAIASTWLLRLFVLALGGFVASFIALSIKADVLPPALRVVLVLAGGAGLIFAGIKLLGRRYNLLGHGLMAGGILVLYLGSYAAGPYYGLFADHSVSMSFAMMVAVAIVSGLLAVRKDSLLSAVLGIAGAFGAPLILKTDAVNYTGLLGYLLILNMAVVYITMKKEWRILNYMAFVLTYILFAFSLREYQSSDFSVVLIFLVLLFVVHSSLVFIRNLIDGKESTTLEVLHMTANALIFASYAYSLINGRFGSPYPAVLTSLMAVFYAVHAYIFLKKTMVDRPLMTGFSALSCLFMALTLPVVMDRGSLTIGYALLALMFLWIGRKIESNFIQTTGSVLYLVVFMRLLHGLATDFEPNPAVKHDFSRYLSLMLDRLVTYGISTASFLCACFLQRSDIKVRNDFAVTLENDMSEIIKRSRVSDVLYWVGVLTGFMFVLLEINSMFSYYTPARQTVLTALWAGMGLYFLWSYTSFRKRDAFAVSAMNAFAAVALLKVLFVDLADWRLNYKWVYGSSYDILDAGMRTLDFAIVIMAFVLIWKVMMPRKTWLSAPVFGYGALFMLLVYSTLELNTLLYFKLKAFQHGGISALWALFAVVFVVAGIQRKLKPLRYTGLGLFAVVAGKVVMIDLAYMDVFYRMLAFLVIALALLGGSFAYIRAGSAAEQTGKTEE